VDEWGVEAGVHEGQGRKKTEEEGMQQLLLLLLVSAAWTCITTMYI